MQRFAALLASVLISLSPALAVAALPSAGTYSVASSQPGNEVSFHATNFVVMGVDGSFKTFSATVRIGEKLESSSVEAKVDVKSIDTDNGRRDTHLKSADYFDAEKFPVMTFKSTSMTPDGDDGFKMTGTLTIKGISRETTFEGRFVADGAEARATINRHHFEISSGPTIKNEIDIRLRIHLKRT
jgi:polyisoprenoid-binding protein YceI